MIPFDAYEIKLADHEARTADWPNIWRLGVVVFTRPQDRICKEIVGPSLKYLSELTGQKVHFYFVGFCTAPIPGYDMAKHDFLGDGESWHFSATAFARIQTKFEIMTNFRWKYSGATDLLVVPYRIRNRVFYIDETVAIDLKLSRLVHQEHPTMTEELIQIVVRELKFGKDIDGLSNSRIMDGIKNGMRQSLLSWLPKGAAEAFRTLEPFAVRSLD